MMNEQKNKPPSPEADRWPWSITDREFGALEQEIVEIRHDLRNLKMIVDNSGAAGVTKQDINDFRAKTNSTVASLKHCVKGLQDIVDIQKKFSEEMTRMKIKVYTAFSVIAVLGSIIVWLVAVAKQFIGSE